MGVRNQTKKTILVTKHKDCRSILSKTIGLMFHSSINDYGLVFHFDLRGKPSLHNFFVFFPIDVLFLENNRVVDLKKGFKPFCPYLKPKHHCDVIIELPAGTIEKSKTELGDKLNLSN